MFNWLLSAFIYETVVTETNEKLNSLRDTITAMIWLLMFYLAQIWESNFSIFFGNILRQLPKLNSTKIWKIFPMLSESNEIN